MKKSIIMMAAALMGVFASAAPVSQQKAAKVAANYVSQQPGAPASLEVAEIEPYGDALYIVNFAPQGFAVVSADDTYYPVVGYSTTGAVHAASLPDNMDNLLREAENGVTSIKRLAKSPNVKWKAYENGAIAVSRAGGERVEPLIQVNFNQSKPYNKYCPTAGGKQAIVGCVAVAMSQAMSVQRYPVQPYGRKSYACPGFGTLTIDYDKEPKYDWDKIVSGSDGWDEAARLMYHAGVAVSMGYGTDGSGIPSNQVYRITDALKEHFGYGSQVNYYWRSSYKGDWEQLILNELYADRAVVYNAIDTKGGYGHSFNIDGFDGDKMFHVNWGWGGTGNGFFRLDHLADAAMNMNYDSNHVAVVGIAGGNNAFRNIDLSDTYIEANKPAGTFVGVVMVNGEIADDSKMNITLSGEYDAASGEYKDTPFAYKNGMLVTEREISINEGPLYVRMEVTLKDNNNSKLRQGFNISVEEHKPVESRSSLKYDRATRTFDFHTRYGAEVKLKDASGAEVPIVKQGILSDYTFSRDQLSAGENTLEVTFEGETKVIKIKK
ncbi:MAG: C10 family peptidase [Muribaculaceae bacterium]|nr:C10 family peptidase [Muribaculaceae bacterium]